MAAIVLESSIGSQYEDSPSSYEFPSQYLKYFQVPPSEPLYAILYEPRGDDGTGRMHYVGWAEIAGPPVPTGRVSLSGRHLYVVQYVAPAEPFEQPVPREILGEPVETWLRKYERGRARNVATFGRAVRPLDVRDFQRILELSGAVVTEVTRYPVRNEHQAPLVAARERSEILVAMLRRSADFRRNVIAAYGQRCAISGFGLGKIPMSKAQGLLDAAHIRPVAYDGSDDVSNGLPLTPTLHRLFDAGLFTIQYQAAVPTILVSPRLERTMITSPDDRFRLDLHDGLPVLLPEDRRAWPNAEQLRFHRERIFLSSA